MPPVNEGGIGMVISFGSLLAPAAKGSTETQPTHVPFEILVVGDK